MVNARIFEADAEALAGEIVASGIRSIAIPSLASELGGLSWSEVWPRVEAALRDLSGRQISARR